MIRYEALCFLGNTANPNADAVSACFDYGIGMTVDLEAFAGRRPHSELTTELFWETYRLSQAFLKVQNHWAKELGVSAPQFLILRSVEEKEDGRGISVKAVAAKLDLHPSSITAQSKILEKLGLLQRTASKADARIVLMSLTLKATSALQSISDDRQALEETICGALPSGEISGLLERIQTLRKRAAKGLRLLTIDEEDL